MKHLSRFDIEAIADKYVQAYMALPDVRNTQIYRIDPELLLERVLGLNVEYQHLSYDGSILGMTSFTEMGVQVFEDDDNEAFFFLDGKTVLVEKDLSFDSELKGRKNFTLMHEGSHQIFKMLFPNDYGITQKSAGVHYYKANSERNKPISDWEEWQANTLGAAILLPENLIKQGMYLFSLGEKIECLNKIYYPSVYKRFDALADFLGCSKKALAIRMKQLGLLKKEYLDNPFDLVTVYPEVSELFPLEVKGNKQESAFSISAGLSISITRGFFASIGFAVPRVTFTGNASRPPPSYSYNPVPSGNTLPSFVNIGI